MNKIHPDPKSKSIRALALTSAILMGLASATAAAEALQQQVSCTTATGEQGFVQEGVCTAAQKGALLMQDNSPIGVRAAVDDKLLKVNAGGSNAAATAGGVSDIAIGVGAFASSPTEGDHASVAIGYEAQATTTRTYAIGMYARATQADTVAMGYRATASATNSVALGSNSSTGTRANTVSIGSTGNERQLTNVRAGTLDTDAINVAQLKPTIAALGGGATFNANGTITGPSYTIQGVTQTTVGGALTALNTAVNTNATNIAVNAGDIVTIRNQIGDLAASGVQYDDAVAQDKVTLGGTSAMAPVSMTNVAEGNLAAGSTDAVNGSQLFATNQNVAANTANIAINRQDIVNLQGQVGDVAAGGVQYDDVLAKDKVTLGGLAATAPVSLTNVGEGTLAAGSTDAVNGSQLFETNENVATNTTNIANNTSAITNLDGRVTNNETSITNIRNEMDSGTIGLVQRDAVTGNITVAGSLGGGVVDMNGTAGPRVVTGVANGRNDTDAVSIAQLKAVGVYDPVADRILGALVYDDVGLGMATLGGVNGTVIANLANGSVAKGSMEAVNGGQLFDMREQLQSQLDNLDGRVGTIETGIADGSIGGGGGGGGPVNDGGGKPIHNVGDGVKDTDAVNVGQVNKQVNEAIETAKNYTDTRFEAVNNNLNNFKNEVSDRFRRVDDKIDRMGAISAANTQMAINAAGATGNGRLAMGVGFQNQKTAMAVGYATQVSDRTRVSVGAAFSGSQNSVGAGIGVDL